MRRQLDETANVPAADGARAPGGASTADLAGRLLTAAGRSPLKRSVAKTVVALGRAAFRINCLLARGSLEGASLAAPTGAANADGDAQKGLDLFANELIVEALLRTPTAYFVSEEEEAVRTLSQAGLLAVAVDPLDGSSNIDTNVPVGTIFSIYPVVRGQAHASFLRPGREQIASGFFIYGSHTALVLTTGDGTDLYVLESASETFRLAAERVSIPPTSHEFAINASNWRHWPAPIRAIVQEYIAGSSGPRGVDFNMRWLASLVGEAYRIFRRGGVFLYPADSRAGYEQGRLRLTYEAAPIALLIEQAGGRAIDGARPILDKVPRTIHERTSLILGSATKVERVQRSIASYDGAAPADYKAPLFRPRGLFDA